MIRIFNKQLVAVESGSVYVADIYCDSSDTKPTTELANGSTLTEVDTGKKYLFNEATTSWVEVSGGGGGGNPNSKETYTGTLDGLASAIGGIIETKYGTLDNTSYGEFLSDIKSGNLSATLTLDLNALVPNSSAVLPIGLSTNEQFLIAITGDMAVVEGEPSILAAVGCKIGYGGSDVWVDDPFAVMYGNGVDLSTYLSAIPYTLTLYWHEMPTA